MPMSIMTISLAIWYEQFRGWIGRKESTIFWLYVLIYSSIWSSSFCSDSVSFDARSSNRIYLIAPSTPMFFVTILSLSDSNSIALTSTIGISTVSLTYSPCECFFVDLSVFGTWRVTV